MSLVGSFREPRWDRILQNGSRRRGDGASGKISRRSAGVRMINRTRGLVERAEISLRAGDTFGALFNCSQAGISLNKYLVKGRGNADQLESEKWSLIYERFEQLVYCGNDSYRMAKNYVCSVPVSRFRREDAEHALCVTKLLLEYCEYLLYAR